MPYEKGVLDAVTMDAIIQFQLYYNSLQTEEDAMLSVLNPLDEIPTIEPETLWLLFNAEGQVFLNPDSELLP